MHLSLSVLNLLCATFTIQTCWLLWNWIPNWLFYIPLSRKTEQKKLFLCPHCKHFRLKVHYGLRLSVALCCQVKSSITYTEPVKLVWKLFSFGKLYQCRKADQRSGSNVDSNDLTKQIRHMHHFLFDTM